MMKNYPNFPNKAHQSAYENGMHARGEGRARFAPYDSGNRSSLHFRKAWLAGYDASSIRAESAPTQAAAKEGSNVA